MSYCHESEVSEITNREDQMPLSVRMTQVRSASESALHLFQQTFRVNKTNGRQKDRVLEIQFREYEFVVQND